MYGVLVAETDPLVREALRIFIERVPDFAVTALVGDGDKALAACSDDSVDLAVLSLTMPKHSGLETAFHIHAVSPATPFIFTGVRQSFDLPAEALHLPYGGYLSKPPSPDAVKTLLMQHQSRHALPIPEAATALEKCLSQGDFRNARAVIPAISRAILVRAGKDPARRHGLMARIHARLAGLQTKGDAEASGQGNLFCVSKPESLAHDAAIELWLFTSVDAAFRTRCEAAQPGFAHIFAFLDASLPTKIGLDDIVNQCAASQSHISRVFKKFFGLSAMDYVHLRKVHRAKMMFVYEKKSAGEAAHALGYSEAGYFSKVFKKYEGVTVQTYKACL